MTLVLSFPVGLAVALPTEADTFPLHLGDVDGRRYLSLPDGMAPPRQVDGVEIHDQPLPDTVRRALAAVQEIDRTCRERIRARISMEDELGALRTNDTETLAFIGQCVAEARAAKTALGV